MDFSLRVEMIDAHGRVVAAIVRPLPREAAFMGERIGDEVSAGVYGSFDQVVEVLKVKELRRGLLADTAMEAGYQIADFLQDREGWHGIERQETTRKIIANAPFYTPKG